MFVMTLIIAHQGRIQDLLRGAKNAAYPLFHMTQFQCAA